MATDSVVTGQFSPELVTAGEELLRALDKLDMKIRAAFWTLPAEEFVWKYVLVSPEARTIGPLALYRKVQAASRKLPTNVLRIPTSAVNVLDDRAPIYTLMRQAVRTSADAVGGIRFSQNVINGQRIDDCYIYRMS
jgi:hypothetical protein